MTLNTTTSPKAWAPDVQTFLPTDVIPEALINTAATLVTQGLEGDGPVARIPWVNDAEAKFVAEGTQIEESQPELAEITVATGKIAQLIPISREQFGQAHAAGLLSESVRRAITKRANHAFLMQPSPEEGEITPPEGLFSSDLVAADDPITTNLDPVADLLATLETNGSTPNLILASPDSWARLRKLKTGTNDNTTLLGAGTSDAEKRLFGIPVQTAAPLPAGTLLIVDKTAVASAVGPIRIAQSEHVYFQSDRIALRATWRIGWKVAHPNRLGLVVIPE